MKASPIQWALCVTCLLLLLAKVWDWWQSLGQSAAPPIARGGAPWDAEGAFPQGGSLQVGLPLSVVAPEIAAGTVTAAHAASPAMIAAPVAPAPIIVVPEPAPDAALSVQAVAVARSAQAAPSAPFAPSALSALAAPCEAPPASPAPEAAPEADPSIAGRVVAAGVYGRSQDAEPEADDVSEPPTELTAHLTELAARELAAARLRAKSMLVNAEEQVRAILDEAERMVAQVAEQAAALPRPQGPDLSESRRQGVREGHAIGLRKGEIDALTRIEQVFSQIESLLDTVPVSRTLPPRRHSW